MNVRAYAPLLLVALSAACGSPDASEPEDDQGELVVGARFISPIATGIYDRTDGRGQIEVSSTTTETRYRIDGRFASCSNVPGDVQAGKVFLRHREAPCEVDLQLTPTAAGFLSSGGLTRVVESGFARVDATGTYERRRANALVGHYVLVRSTRAGANVSLDISASDDRTLTVRLVNADLESVSGVAEATQDSALTEAVFGKAVTNRYVLPTPECSLAVVPERTATGYAITVLGYSACPSGTWLQATHSFERR